VIVRVVQPLHTEPSSAISGAFQILAGQGFEVERVDATTLRARGGAVNSSKENALRGAGNVTVEAGEGQVIVCADRRGIRSSTAFVVLFPPLLVIGITAWRGDMVTFGLPHLLVWAIVGPAMALRMHRRAGHAVEVFALNIAQWK